MGFQGGERIQYVIFLAYPSVIYTTTGTYLFCVPSFVAFDFVPIQVLGLDGLLSLLLHSHLLDAVRGRGSYTSLKNRDYQRPMMGIPIDPTRISWNEILGCCLLVAR